MPELFNTRTPEERRRACRCAGEVLRAGGIVVYPTDTTYALGVNATDDAAVARLFGMKRRARGKPVHLAVASIDLAARYAVLNSEALTLAAAFLPGPLTLVVPRRGEVPDSLVAGLPTVGIRIPDHELCLEMLESAGIAVTATSANLSGEPAAYSVAEIQDQFGDAVAAVDMILDGGRLPLIPPSTVVDLTHSPPRILRQGPVSLAELRRVLPEIAEGADDRGGHTVLI